MISDKLQNTAREIGERVDRSRGITPRTAGLAADHLNDLAEEMEQLTRAGDALWDDPACLTRGCAAQLERVARGLPVVPAEIAVTATALTMTARVVRTLECCRPAPPGGDAEPIRKLDAALHGAGLSSLATSPPTERDGEAS